MQDVSKMPVEVQETRLASNGGTYISSILYKNAYFSVKVYYNEIGSEIKRTEKKLA